MIPSNGIGCVVYSAVVQKQLDQCRKLSDPKRFAAGQHV
jgi:hypothetical protein